MRSNNNRHHHHHMPLASRRRGGGGGNPGTSKTKITIRPYSKPPALPANYYDKSVGPLLQGTLDILKQQQQQASSSSSHKGSGTSLSLQNAYQTIVTLVRHQYGPRLYQDWMASLQKAVAAVLDPDKIHASDQQSQSQLLSQLPIQFKQFTDYLLVCKHVFLALDRTHVWNPATQTAVPISGGGASAAAASAAAASSSNQQQQSNKTSSTASSGATQTLWTAGLAQFRARCFELNLEQALYQEWLQALLDDWNTTSTSSSSTSTSSSTATINRNDLRDVWYMWQDLGLLTAQSPLTLQVDLERYWRNAGTAQWNQATTTGGSSSSTNATANAARQFLAAAYRQHAHVRQWPWLPVPWLWHILDTCVVQPVLNKEKLLNPAVLHPLLQHQVFHPDDDDNDDANKKSATTDMDVDPSATVPYRRRPIQQLWMLAGRLPTGQSDVAAAICDFCKTEGLSRLQQQQQPPPAATAGSPQHQAAAANKNTTSNTNPTAAIADLLQLQECVAAMIHTLPAGATDLINLKQTWEEVVNSSSFPTAEALAKFLDQILRSNKKMDLYQSKQQQVLLQNAAAAGGGSSGSSSTAAAAAAMSASEYAWLSRIIAGLFVPLSSKDVFEAFYKRDLAKRLLWNRSVNQDVEKQVCSLLKAECGAGYTSKMEGMFQDIDLSRESMMVYKQQQQQSDTGGTPRAASAAAGSSVEMEVQILTTGYWPVYPQYPNLHLPASLQQQQEQFDAHYQKKCHGRRITWQYALGHCIVRTAGFPKAYELVVSLCQAVVLVQFVSDETVWTLPRLLQATGLEDRDEMERILQSLALGKEGTRILRRREATAASSSNDKPAAAPKKKKMRLTVHDQDEFVINRQFTSNQRRIRIQNILMKETREERNKTVEAVSRDRLYLMDAVLVRILKARKTVSHQSLIAQVLEQVKFPAAAADVKQRIESLIEREYMERDSKDRSRYNYLA